MRLDSFNILANRAMIIAIIGIVAGLALASLLDATNPPSARRGWQNPRSPRCAMRANALHRAPMLENYKQPPISIDFINANSTATVVTDGTTRTTFSTPASPGGTGSWTYVYPGSTLTLPSVGGLRPPYQPWRDSGIFRGTPTTVFNFTGDGRLDNSHFRARPRTPANQEARFRLSI